eukprot:TRINITY_DN17015_c0_g1_i1.p1 TRINITY_DN17015_c0_g1~~TRINITY_DN17015_c0_g1_i1.p1  ORF type:complete len:516 (+),score=108.21 TRINITY_DN17015_c0_g1_i1:335-1882(+)
MFRIRCYYPLASLLLLLLATVCTGLSRTSTPSLTSSNAVDVSNDYHAIPQQVHLSLLPPSLSSSGFPDGILVTFVVKTPLLSPTISSSSQFNPVVQFGTREGIYTHTTPSLDSTRTYPYAEWTGRLYDVPLTNLLSNTKYYYRIGEAPFWSKEFSFVSPPNHRTHNRIRVAFYGDTAAGDQAQKLVLDLEKQTDKLDLIVHTGDFGYACSVGRKWDITQPWYARDKVDTWDLWGEMFEPLTSAVPYMTTPGNHETAPYGFDLAIYGSRFRMPGAEKRPWYSYNYGNIHFISASSESDYSVNSPQHRWLKKDLHSIDRSNTPWCIFYVHRPLYSSSIDFGSVLDLRAALEPILMQHGVDLVVTGHDHGYERTYPVYKGKVTDFQPKHYKNPGGIIHLKVGTGGVDLGNGFRDEPVWSVIRDNDHFGYLTVEVDGGKLVGRFSVVPNVKGGDEMEPLVLDSFTIVKKRSHVLFYVLLSLGVVISLITVYVYVVVRKTVRSYATERWRTIRGKVPFSV